MLANFDIRQHVEFNSKGRGICPACALSKGIGHSKLNLSVMDSGAYKCFVGCTPEEIREALGQPTDRQVPTAIAAPPPKNVTVTPKLVSQAHERLLNSKHCLQWLLERGIPLEAIKHYKLGSVRSKAGAGHLPAISIPIPSNDDGTHYYQKKRIAPWLDGNDTARNGAAPWCQYGIPQTVYFTHKPPGAKETILCEGEWDAIRLGWEMRHLTEVAIACFTCGCSNVPTDSELEKLPGKVIIFYDLDQPGEKGAAKVQAKLKDRALIATVPHRPQPPKGWDITDALNDGFTIVDIAAAAAAATPWAQPGKENPLKARLSTNDEMISRAQDYVEWLVPDILTQDELFILGMPPRGGKSLFCLTLAKAVATGGLFLDRPVTQGSVIYINLEDSETKIKQRQIAQGWGEGLPVYWLDKFKLSELEHLGAIADEMPDLRLIVMDTFSRVRDDGTKESSAELGQILEPLQEFAKQRGVTVLITHHTGKGSKDEGHGADPFDMLRGSTSIRATCRGAIVIVPGENSYRLLAENGYADRLDVNVRINPETLEWKLLGNWTPRVDGDMKAQILDHLNLIGEATIAEIAKALSLNAASVSTVMGRLHRDDMVTKQGGNGRSPGRYMRSSNLFKQLDAEFEHPKPDSVRRTDVVQTDNLCGVSPLKVITQAKSDQLFSTGKTPIDHPPSEGDQWRKPMTEGSSSDSVSLMYGLAENPSQQALQPSDHFCSNTPLINSCLNNAGNPCGVCDVCSNRANIQFEQEKSGQGGKSTRYRYSGRNLFMNRLCKGKHLEIIAENGEFATVNHKDWLVTQTIPVTELKPIK